MELFTPVVPVEALHPNFSHTLDLGAAGVRAVLADWADGFEDRDFKFVKEFQTTYNSSFWELYLFAVLKQLKIAIDFSVEAPDFVAREHALAIEAVIASHAQDDVPEWNKTIEGVTNTDLGRLRQIDPAVGKCSPGQVEGLHREVCSASPHDRPELRDRDCKLRDPRLQFNRRRADAVAAVRPFRPEVGKKA